MNNSKEKSLLINPDLQKETNNILNYLEQLTPLQRKAYEIAKEHLKTSFDIERSNGFNEWVNGNK